MRGAAGWKVVATGLKARVHRPFAGKSSEARVSFEQSYHLEGGAK